MYTGGVKGTTKEQTMNATNTEWSFTMDSDGHLTIKQNRREVWNGSYEAFCADGDIAPPREVTEQIHARYDEMDDGGEREDYFE